MNADICFCCFPCCAALCVQELLGPLADAVGAARRVLAGCGDLERTLARLAASSSSEGGLGREAAHVVLYEDMSKRRVKGLVKAVRDMQALEQALKALGEVRWWEELGAGYSGTEVFSEGDGKEDKMQELNHSAKGVSKTKLSYLNAAPDSCQLAKPPTPRHLH